MTRLRSNPREGTYQLPITYLPALTELSAKGLIHADTLPPTIRSALGRTAQQHGLWSYQKASIIQTNCAFKIIYVNEKYLTIQKTPEPRLDTL